MKKTFKSANVDDETMSRRSKLKSGLGSSTRHQIIPSPLSLFFISSIVKHTIGSLSTKNLKLDISGHKTCLTGYTRCKNHGKKRIVL